MEYTCSSTNLRNYEKKLGFLKNKICTNLFYVHVPKWTSVKLDLFPCLVRDRKSPPQEISSLMFLAKKLICFGKTSVPQTACLLSEVNKYTAELSLGSSRNTLSQRAQMSTEICIKLFTRRRIKRQDRRRSFSISLNFYQTILESSPQTRFMLDIKKFNIINRCANIYSWRNTGWPRAVEYCNWFARIPSNSQSRSHYWLVQVYGTKCNVALLHNSVCHCFTLLRFITTWN